MSEKQEQELPPPYYDDASHAQSYPQKGSEQPNQGGYPQNQGGYPQYGGYPAQQGGYPPQQGGYGAPPGAVIHQPGQTTVIMAGPVANPPNDHLAFNIFVTICCCWPIGIFAILKSVETRDMINRGDANGAVVSSKKAKKYGCCALGFGIASVVLSFIIIAIYVGLIVSGAVFDDDHYK